MTRSGGVGASATRCAPAFSNATLPTVRDGVNDFETAKLRRGVQACPQPDRTQDIPMEVQRTAARLQLEGEPQLALREPVQFAPKHRAFAGRLSLSVETTAVTRKYAPEVMAELARLALQAQSETARVAAGKEILDRAYGKAPAADNFTFVEALKNLEKLSDFQLAEVIKIQEKIIATTEARIALGIALPSKN